MQQKSVLFPYLIVLCCSFYHTHTKHSWNLPTNRLISHQIWSMIVHTLILCIPCVHLQFVHFYMERIFLVYTISGMKWTITWMCSVWIIRASCGGYKVKLWASFYIAFLLYHFLQTLRSFIIWFFLNCQLYLNFNLECILSI